MWLINVQALIKMEWIVNMGCRMDHRAKVLEFRDDEATDYAILSHRWIDQEVHYDEITEFAKMERDEQDEIRHRDGYQKILASCEQAKRDGYEWLWADTCCIDKRSSAELSEAINSMYRWYQNSKVCYAYLHDVPGASFPTQSDNEKYRESNGWPEWFSRGWTLQEMIAPGNVQFFNQNWQSIGDKRSLAHTLTKITRVPWHILTGGLSPDRPCVAQIMSWAADRKTTRVEDRAYSLTLNLFMSDSILIVNMTVTLQWALDNALARIGYTSARALARQLNRRSTATLYSVICCQVGQTMHDPQTTCIIKVDNMPVWLSTSVSLDQPAPYGLPASCGTAQGTVELRSKYLAIPIVDQKNGLTSM
ncbi:heterokaryon incompatibility protein-domain-containing protein [Scleroderma citrinum]